ncbi:hypothetical protein C7B80_16750 [Cyanosarcina cf. burmensis CCALA 770]|nr:hypothetical protein C7B80_16750 [Cyanosarcina cf. burmensis CCALA 770]
MNNANLEERAEEIIKLVENNESSAAIKRLLDFVKELPQQQKNDLPDVITLSSEVSAFTRQQRLYGMTQHIQEWLISINSKIVDFTYSILNDYKSPENQIILDSSISPTLDDNTPSDAANAEFKNNNSSSSISFQQAPSKVLFSDRYENSNEKEENSSNYQAVKSIFPKYIKKRESTYYANLVFPKHYNFVFIGQEIDKTYKSRSVNFKLKNISLELELGRITSVVGENGNGKTTLLRIVAGELAASAGKVSYPCLSLNSKSDWYSIKEQIAYIPQELPRWHGLLAENLHFVASIHGITGKANEYEVDWIIYRLGLEQYKKAKWNEISGGYKRRFALAMALICKPKLLILDEPMANLDINTQMPFLQDLRHLANSYKYPIAVLISSQHLYDVEKIADQIIFIKNGEAKYNGLVKDIGSDRKFNYYEIDCDLSQENLNNVLQNMGYTKIEKVGGNFIIHTSLSIKNTDLIGIFAENNVSLKYFRDISKSTRTFFEEKS